MITEDPAYLSRLLWSEAKITPVFGRYGEARHLDFSWLRYWDDFEGTEALAQAIVRETRH